ncbi:MAG: recombinase family protein [Geobacteraceae bacterium]|nr:recombinase family protein [Geobacteraceae bacterium]
MSETLHSYTRVSTAVQEEDGTSLDTQKELGIRIANELGFLHEVWNEGGQSSAKDDFENRSILVELLKEIEKDRVKHIFVYNTDGLSLKLSVPDLFRLYAVEAIE